jgi:hypothetical protein
VLVLVLVLVLMLECRWRCPRWSASGGVGGQPLPLILAVAKALTQQGEWLDSHDQLKATRDQLMLADSRCRDYLAVAVALTQQGKWLDSYGRKLTGSWKQSWRAARFVYIA